MYVRKQLAAGTYRHREGAFSPVIPLISEKGSEGGYESDGWARA